MAIHQIGLRNVINIFLSGLEKNTQKNAKGRNKQNKKN